MHMGEIVDVDTLESDSLDPDIQFTGFARNVSRSAHHSQALSQDGLVYTGFNSTPAAEREAANRARERKRKRGHPIVQLKSSSSGPGVPRDVIEILDSDEEEEKSPPKRVKTCHSGSRSGSIDWTPQESPLFEISQYQCTASTSPGPSQDKFDVDDEYANYMAALDLNHRPNWEEGTKVHMGSLDGDGDLNRPEQEVVDAAASVAEDMMNRRLGLITRLQCQSEVIVWPEQAASSCQPCYIKQIQQAAMHSTSLNGRRVTFRQTLRDLRPVKVFHIAPSHITTILPSGNLLAVASAVENGALDDTPGPYNKEGSLSVIDYTGGKNFVLSGHSIQEGIGRSVHYFTVNDVTVDPACPKLLASAGRDRKICIWDCDPVQRGEAPALLREITCRDNPEVIKYYPQGSVLAIQSDDGCVYFTRGESLEHGRFTVASPQLCHVTAEMTWGVGPTDKLLFASSAHDPDTKPCGEESRGFHKAYDVVKQKVVVEFNADRQPCSALALSPSGESIYIATEKSDGGYIIRRFSVRQGNSRRIADQQVVLEPFAGDPLFTDINTLAVCQDEFYIAVGRTDNRLDVYDARMLRRGPLYYFAHEIVSGVSEPWGVVKAQWVENQVYGSGLVSGGLDGCIRLWDVKRASDDPHNGRVLARCAYDVSTFALGDVYRHDIPITVGERSGQVTLFDYTSEHTELGSHTVAYR